MVSLFKGLLPRYMFDKIVKILFDIEWYTVISDEILFFYDFKLF